MTTGWLGDMERSSRRLEEGLPKEDTQRMNGIRWDQGRGRAEAASRCRRRGEHGTSKERKEVQTTSVHNTKGTETWDTA